MLMVYECILQYNDFFNIIPRGITHYIVSYTLTSFLLQKQPVLINDMLVTLRIPLVYGTHITIIVVHVSTMQSAGEMN